MFKKTITYDDLDGNRQSEDFYFHMTTAELARMSLHNNGLEEWLKRLIASNNGKEITETFENIILGAYGVRSEDRKKFIKESKDREEFRQSEAYSVLFMELITDAQAAADFVNNLMPKSTPQDKPAGPPETRNVFGMQGEPTEETKALKLSAVDIMAMTPEEFANLKAIGKF